jgi:ABC-type branched-subunit amino acid transport system ATPase component
MSEAMLQIDGLVRHFGGVHAVDDISFDVERGQVLGFIGPNGAGKTTTMRIRRRSKRLRAETHGSAGTRSWTIRRRSAG